MFSTSSSSSLSNQANEMLERIQRDTNDTIIRIQRDANDTIGRIQRDANEMFHFDYFLNKCRQVNCTDITTQIAFPGRDSSTDPTNENTGKTNSGVDLASQTTAATLHGRHNKVRRKLSADLRHLSMPTWAREEGPVLKTKFVPDELGVYEEDEDLESPEGLENLIKNTNFISY